MANYDKIIKQIELLNHGQKLLFAERLVEKNETLASSLSNYIDVTMMDKAFLENEKKVQKAIA
jgi:hypothetical protein